MIGATTTRHAVTARADASRTEGRQGVPQGRAAERWR